MIVLKKPEGNRPIERPRLRWENNIKTNLKVAATCTGFM
jgi:hypothetical protein